MLPVGHGITGMDDENDDEHGRDQHRQRRAGKQPRDQERGTNQLRKNS